MNLYLFPNAEYLSHEGVLAYWVGRSPNLIALACHLCLTCFRIFGHLEPEFGGNIQVSSNWNFPVLVSGNIDFSGGLVEEWAIR